jgi:glutaminyl-peptide cyclotransferase
MRKSIEETYSSQSTTLRIFLTLSFLIFIVLSFSSCPKTGKQTNSINLKISSRSSNVEFDQERAFMHVRKQVEIGPRPAGSAELIRTRDYIVDQLKSYNLEVSIDEFQAETPEGIKTMFNIVAELKGEIPKMILLGSHYDTKLFKEFRFVGANDGASSTGLLLELARVLSSRREKPHFTYRFIFFDGEEAVCHGWDDCSRPDTPDNTYGSRHYVSKLIKSNELRLVHALVLLDMVGYKDLQFGRDEMSTIWLIDAIWQTARELGFNKYFVDRIEGVGGDDHEPFLKAGVEAVNIIQLNTYPYWHTPQDTLDKISPNSLKIVGNVVLASLPRIEKGKK